MSRIQSEYHLPNSTNNLWYEVLEDGYKIYTTETAQFPMYHQYEPFIFDRNPELENNLPELYKDCCLKHIKSLCDLDPNSDSKVTIPDRIKSLEDQATETQIALCDVYELVSAITE